MGGPSDWLATAHEEWDRQLAAGSQHSGEKFRTSPIGSRDGTLVLVYVFKQVLCCCACHLYSTHDVGGGGGRVRHAGHVAASFMELSLNIPDEGIFHLKEIFEAHFPVDLTSPTKLGFLTGSQACLGGGRSGAAEGEADFLKRIIYQASSPFILKDIVVHAVYKYR